MTRRQRAELRRDLALDRALAEHLNEKAAIRQLYRTGERQMNEHATDAIDEEVNRYRDRVAQIHADFERRQRRPLERLASWVADRLEPCDGCGKRESASKDGGGRAEP